jgi:hypothetical protein
MPPTIRTHPSFTEMAVELAKQLRDHTKADALESYEDLKSATPASPPDALTVRNARRMGLPTLDHFFLHHRIKAKTKAHLSFYDAIKDPEKRKHLTELVVRYKKKPLSDYNKESLLKAQYQVFQLYYGSINQFRPIVAKWVYLHFKPKGILDFSAGWGGRALAAMSLGIPYIGIDANKKLAPAYRQMIATLEPKSSVTLYFQPAETVDFSRFQGKYDLIFTSPPYFMIEEYEKMPAYKTKEGFLQIFFIPTVLSAWKYLPRRGHMALNMPKEMYDAIRTHLPPLHQTIKMPLSNRHPTNASRKQVIGHTDKERSELIYVWRKP